MSTDVRKLPPVNRKPRPVRRDHGDYIRALAFDELALKAVLIKTGVPTSHINQAVYDINEAVSYHGSQSRPAQVLKDAHEREDLQELQARITYVLDSLHALSNESRERILSLAIPYSKEADPHYIECSLRKLDYRVRGVLHVMPTEGILAGKPAYNNTRNTPLLASLAGVWFQAFPDDAGVRRDGQYAEKGTAEYHGELLNFVVAIINFFNVTDMGSQRMIGQRLMQRCKQRDAPAKPLQSLIRAKFQAAKKPSDT
jgi:hypothetical protein